MNFLPQNIRYLRDVNNLSQEAFGKLFGLTRGQVASYEREENPSEPVVDTISAIADHYGLSLDTFLRIKLADFSGNHASSKVIEQENGSLGSKGVKIFIMDTQAAAGFPAEYQNPAFYNSLTRFQFPIGDLGDGLYIAIQARGDSMQPTFFHDDWLLAKLINEREELKEGNCYVVLTEEGVVAKRLAALQVQLNLVTLASDNDYYENQRVAIRDCLQWWEIKAKFSFELDLDPRDKEVNQLKSQMNNMMAELEDIKRKLGQ